MDLGFGPGPDDSTAAASPGVIRRFGDYELLEQIGRGGMGVVYKARHVSLKRLVALKMLGPHASAFPGIAQRLRLEAEAAASLRHPQIVTIYDVGEHDGQPYFTMELIEGAGLDKRIALDGFLFEAATCDQHGKRNGREAHAVRVMIHIARAVDHAHKHGVLHRDLKPANVLIDVQGQPHLTDFGLAKIVGRAGTEGTALGTILGTPAYMAPEQASGKSMQASTAADIYSLGAILYQMLTGRPPFRGETPLETLRQVVEELPKPPGLFNRHLDADLATIAVKCLEKNPQHRYDSAQALAEDLERWLRGEPIAARAVGRWERAWCWCRREPLLAAMTAGSALLLVAAAVFAFIAYHLTQKQLEEERKHHEYSLTTLQDRIGRDWDENIRRFVKLDSEELGLLSGFPVRRDGNETIIRVGIQLSGRDYRDSQLKVVMGHPLAHHLRTNLVPRAVLCELYIYKSSSDLMAAVLAGEVDIIRLTSAAYVEAGRHKVAVLPLVAEIQSGKSELTAAIFAHADAGIERLTEVKGHSFAFCEWDSAASHFLPKKALLESGLHARDLSAWTNCPSWHVISLVRNGHFSAGAADLDDVKKLIDFGARLRLLKELRSPAALWVATTNLPPDLLFDVQRSFLTLTNAEVLGGITRGLTGFRSTKAEEYDALERDIEKAKRFDQP